MGLPAAAGDLKAAAGSRRSPRPQLLQQLQKAAKQAAAAETRSSKQCSTQQEKGPSFEAPSDATDAAAAADAEAAAASETAAAAAEKSNSTT
ncbi:hypothetical protein Efla_007149 [Eimeria flavescens]